MGRSWDYEQARCLRLGLPKRVRNNKSWYYEKNRRIRLGITTPKRGRPRKPDAELHRPRLNPDRLKRVRRPKGMQYPGQIKRKPGRPKKGTEQEELLKFARTAGWTYEDNSNN